MDEYRVEVDELREHAVVLAVPALRLLVFGRTLDEATSQARASIAFRQETAQADRPPEQRRPALVDGPALAAARRTEVGRLPLGARQRIFHVAELVPRDAHRPRLVEAPHELQPALVHHPP
jgi:hypothetical protein